MTPAGLFYSVTALVLIALTLAGFQHFFFHGMSYPGRPITPPIRGLIIAHGVAMSLWLVVFLVQPLLVATGRVRTHMAVGKVGAAVAAGVLVLGMLVAVNSARVSPPEMKIWNLPPKQFMAVPFFGALTFAGFVAVAIWQRRKPAIHRAMMLTGTFAAMSAAVSRIDLLNNLYVGTMWETVFGPFFFAQIIFGLLLVTRCAITRSFDKWMAIGFAVLTLICIGVMRLAPTSTWESFASMLTG